MGILITTQCTAFQNNREAICNTRKLVSSRRLHLVGNNALEGIGSPSNPGVRV